MLWSIGLIADINFNSLNTNSTLKKQKHVTKKNTQTLLKYIKISENTVQWNKWNSQEFSVLGSTYFEEIQLL